MAERGKLRSGGGDRLAIFGSGGAVYQRNSAHINALHHGELGAADVEFVGGGGDLDAGFFEGGKGDDWFVARRFDGDGKVCAVFFGDVGDGGFAPIRVDGGDFLFFFGLNG